LCNKTKQGDVAQQQVIIEHSASSTATLCCCKTTSRTQELLANSTDAFIEVLKEMKGKQRQAGEPQKTNNSHQAKLWAGHIMHLYSS
jgi:hypothetical protein